MTATIEVYADIWCPFTHVGLSWFVRRRRELGRDNVRLLVRAWPLELVNGRPQDPETTLAHVNTLRSHVAPELFRGFEADQFPSSTLEALALAAAAYVRDAALGEQVSLELRELLFERGVDVSSPLVLAGLAHEHGLSIDAAAREAILDEWRGGTARGVQGSPHFFCGDRDVFCPALDLSRDDAGALQVGERSDRLHAFIDECLAGLGATH